MEFVALTHEPTELLEELRVEDHDAVAPAAQFFLFHGRQQLVGLGAAALDDPEGGLRTLHGEFVQLGHGAFAAFDPEGGSHVIADDRQVGHERDRVVLDHRLDLDAFVKEQHIGQKLESHMTHRLVNSLADDDLVGKRPVPILAAKLKVKFVGQERASNKGVLRPLSMRKHHRNRPWSPPVSTQGPYLSIIL